MTSQLKKDVFKVRQNRAKIRDPDAILGQTMNQFGHQVVAPAVNGESQIRAAHLFNSWDCPKALFSKRVFRRENDCSLRAVSSDEPLRSVDVDDPSVLDDCYPVAQPFGLLHQMCGQKNCLTTLANAAHQVPDRPPRLRVQPSGQLVKKDHLRIVDQRKSNKQPLLLASREVHKPGVSLVDEAQLFEQPFAVYRFLLVKRSPEVYRFPHFDPLLQLRLLKLNPDAVLQLVDVPKGIKTQNRDGAPVGSAQTFDALHRGGLSRTVRPD